MKKIQISVKSDQKYNYNAKQVPLIVTSDYTVTSYIPSTE